MRTDHALARGMVLRLAGVNLLVGGAVLYAALSAFLGSATAQPEAAVAYGDRAEALAVALGLKCTVEPHFVETVMVAAKGEVRVLSFEQAMSEIAAGRAAVVRFCQ